MPANKLKCVVCGTEFWGRIDAIYCSKRCNQQAVRDRRKQPKR